VKLKADAVTEVNMETMTPGDCSFGTQEIQQVKPSCSLMSVNKVNIADEVIVKEEALVVSVHMHGRENEQYDSGRDTPEGGISASTSSSTSPHPHSGKGTIKPKVNTIAYITMKHPLEYPWTLWYQADNHYLRNMRSQDWANCLHHGATFDTIEDFWGIYNITMPPSTLPPNCAYNVFRNGIKPEWEDPQNRMGGRWTVQESIMYTNVDRIWKEVLLCLIGNIILGPYSDAVAGVVLQAKREGSFKLHVWMLTTHENHVTNVSERLQFHLESILGLNFNLEFASHSKRKYIMYHT